MAHHVAHRAIRRSTRVWFLILSAMVLMASACSGTDDGETGDGDDAPLAETTTLPLRDEVESGNGTSLELGLSGPHLAVVVDQGGLCPDGGCVRMLELTIDGTWLLTSQGGETSEGTYDADRIAELVSEADVAEINLGEFRGQCPTAFDGVERTYLVYSPEDPSATVLDVASCREQLNADAPLLIELDLLFTDAGR